MDYPASPKQSTLAQYSMSASGDDKHSVQEESANDYSRANAISTVKSAIENNPDVFTWNRMTRNSDITAETQRRNKEIISIDDKDSDDDFMPKPCRRFTKP